MHWRKLDPGVGKQRGEHGTAACGEHEASLLTVMREKALDDHIPRHGAADASRPLGRRAKPGRRKDHGARPG